jgi:DNA polymerase III gamma/tau subunit
MASSYLILGGNSVEREKEVKKLYSRLKPQKASFTHDPDLTPLEGENSIGIDQVRELEHSLSLKPHSFPPKIGLVTQAEKLTIEAQNALLKVLEEPTGDSVLILAAPRKENLLPTVVSRCQLIALPEKAEIELSQEEIKKLSQELEKFLKSSPGKRIQLVNDIKTRDEAIAFCQAQLVLWRELLLKQLKQPKSSKTPSSLKLLSLPCRQAGSHLSTPEITSTIRRIEKTLKYLRANANVRLSLDNLLLSYPSLKK